MECQAPPKKSDFFITLTRYKYVSVTIIILYNEQKIDYHANLKAYLVIGSFH